MQKVFLDTNIFIRFLTRDEEKKFKECLKLFEKIKEGKIKPYTSNIVILEVIFVLIRLYNFPKDKVVSALKSLLQMRNLVLIEKTDTRKTLSKFKKLKIKYSDCLISTQIPSGVVVLTYDKDFSKIPDIATRYPSQI